MQGALRVWAYCFSSCFGY